MKSAPLKAALCFLLTGVAGCNQATIRKPTLCGAGTAQQQRREAVRFDPYPENDIGPEIDGGRPLGYLNPRPEPEIYRDFIKYRSVPVYPAQ